jgi:hypothetical protein
VQRGELVVGFAGRFRHQSGGHDIEDVVEMVEDAKLCRRALGMAAIAIGEDEFAARQCPDLRAEGRVRRKMRVVDIVHLLQKIVRVDAVPDHQPVQRRAVVAIKLFLQRARLIARQFKQFRHIGRHAHVDLGEQVRVMRVKRIVEVEHPVADAGEVGRFGNLCHAALSHLCRRYDSGRDRPAVPDRFKFDRSLIPDF